MTIKEIQDQVANLIKTNQISEPTQLSHENFVISDLQPIFFKYFNQDALNLVSNKTNNLIHQYNRYHKFGSEHNAKLTDLLEKLELKHCSTLTYAYTREIAKVFFFGVTTTKDRLAEGALTMVKVINALATNKYAIATLSPLTSIQFNTLCPVTGKIVPDNKYAIFSYLAIDHQYETLVQSMYADYLFPEGGVPPELK